MKKRAKFVTKRSRIFSGSIKNYAGIKNLGRIFAGLVLLFMAVYAAGKVFVYSGEKLRGFKPEINLNLAVPFSSPKYIIYSEGKIYGLYEGGRFQQLTGGFDASGLPVLTGVMINEAREPQKNALRMALSLSRERMATISEISLKDPDNITLITIDGVTVLAGPTINDIKMRNYEAAVKRASEMHKRYSVMDLRFKDRVIIR